MTTAKVEALIQRHVQRYAQIEIQDVYKLLHQAVFGPGHPIVKRKAAQEWLEWQSGLLESVPAQPLMESIHPDDAVVRVYMRPYVDGNGNLKKLLDAFVDSAKIIEGDLSKMAEWWAVFQQMTEKNRTLAERFDPRNVALFGRTRAKEQWPATHHSLAFDQSYKPIYRVMTRSMAEGLLERQNLAFEIV